MDSNAMRKSVLASGGFIAVCLLCIFSCRGKVEKQLKFVVEKGFRGPFVITNEGEDSFEDTPDGYVLHVGNQRTIHCHNANEFLSKWHSIVLVDSEGNVLDDYRDPKGVLHEGPAITRGLVVERVFFIGTRAEYDEFISEFRERLTKGNFGIPGI